MQPRVEDNLACCWIMVEDERARIVEKHLFGHAAECKERRFDPVEPIILLLIAIDAHMQTAGIAERGDEKEDLLRLAADCCPAFAKIDLQLFTWLRLKPDRRSCRRNQLPPQRCNRSLDGP
jgi:hypothetical protein